MPAKRPAMPAMPAPVPNTGFNNNQGPPAGNRPGPGGFNPGQAQNQAPGGFNPGQVQNQAPVQNQLPSSMSGKVNRPAPNQGGGITSVRPPPMVNRAPIL